MRYIFLLLLAASAHAAPLVGTGDVQPSVSFSSAIAVGTNTAPTSAITVYGVITSSTPVPSVSCTAGTGVMTAGSTAQFGSFAAGTLATACTVTFSTVFPFPKTPFCQCQSNANLLVFASAVSKTALTCTAASALTGDTVTYLCQSPP
jgi:hypothetical protein